MNHEYQGPTPAPRYELVRLLLSWGADVNCYFTALSDTVFPTALQYCIKDPMMLRLLLNNGYNAEKYTDDQPTDY